MHLYRRRSDIRGFSSVMPELFSVHAIQCGVLSGSVLEICTCAAHMICDERVRKQQTPKATSSPYLIGGGYRGASEPRNVPKTAKLDG